MKWIVTLEIEIEAESRERALDKVDDLLLELYAKYDTHYLLYNAEPKEEECPVCKCKVDDVEYWCDELNMCLRCALLLTKKEE